MFYVGTLWEPLPREPWKACRNTCLESFTCDLGNLHLGTFTRKPGGNFYLGTFTVEPWEPLLVYILRLAGTCINVTWEPLGPVLGHLYLGTLAILEPYSTFICET